MRPKGHCHYERAPTIALMSKKPQTPKERKALLRAERLSDMKEQIADGSLICRKMTKAEEKKFLA